MFKNYCKLLTRSKQLTAVQFSSAPKEKWDLLTAVCLERKPIITPSLNQLEQDYKALLSQIELERSLKSDHELRHEKELKQIENLKKGDDIDGHIKQTAQELFDSYTEELNNFKSADRLTEADKRNDLKSTNRKLDKHLVLVVQQKIGKDTFFMLPQAARQDGETLRQSAERVLNQYCGNEVKANIYGNAPSSVYKYKYPPAVQEKNQSVGAKVFIYFARYQKGNLPKLDVDYKWLDRAELKKTLPRQYQDSVLDMLIDESN